MRLADGLAPIHKRRAAINTVPERSGESHIERGGTSTLNFPLHVGTLLSVKVRGVSPSIHSLCCGLSVAPSGGHFGGMSRRGTGVMQVGELSSC